MIRPLTCICMLMAAGSGLYLYQTKHRAQLLDREIAHNLKQIDQTKERIGVLKGEWALLNEPERLADLARQHLALHTLAPAQFVALADLGNRLPAPLPPGTNVNMALDQPAVPATAAISMAAGKPGPSVAPSQRPAVAAAATTPAMQLAALPQPALPPRPAQRPAVSASASASGSPAANTPAGVAPILAAAAPALPRIAAQARPQPAQQAQTASQPQPDAPASQPTRHIMAPIVNVSASQSPSPATPAHAAGPAPMTIGESVARAARVAPVPRTTFVSATTPIPSVSTAMPSVSSAPAYVGSALGGAGRVALPAPVPYGAR